MIISKISGGLGNQMFQYAIAKSIAIKNNDKFSLDISFYPKQTLRKYELSLFKIEENLQNAENIFEKIKRKLGFISKEYFIEKEIATFDKDVFRYGNNIILDGYWQNENYFKDIRVEILKDFIPKNSISDESKGYLSLIASLMSVSLHIRRGDYVQDSTTNVNHGICGIEYYKEAIQYFENKFTNITFFIFSDDIAWCKENFEFIDNKVFIDNTKNAIEDLELMKNCKHNIIANSTFSWWGAWLNSHKDKIVIAPKQWFAKKEWQDENIACDNWVKI